MELSFFSASPALLIAIFVVDLVIGDPVSKYHPVVIIGKCLRFFETKFFEKKCWNRFGGVLLFLLLCLTILFPTYLIYVLLHSLHESIALLYLALLGGLLLAFRSLVTHARAVSPGSEGDLEKMKEQVSRIVGRDTDKMDEQGCRRAAIESLAESLVDGILTPIFFFALAGVPGMILFKIINIGSSFLLHNIFCIFTTCKSYFELIFSKKNRKIILFYLGQDTHYLKLVVDITLIINP